METKIKKAGRPRKKLSEKVIVVSAYLTNSEQKLVKRKYGSISKALRDAVLPLCG